MRACLRADAPDAQEERQHKLLMKSSVALHGDGEGKPSICEASRRLAEKANAGVSLADRLANKSGAHPGRAASMPSELQECVHAPSINQKSEQLAMQLHGRFDGTRRQRRAAG